MARCYYCQYEPTVCVCDKGKGTIMLLTGHGRSGTKWVARELGKSKLITVEHERGLDSQYLRSCHEDSVFKLIQQRFNAKIARKPFLSVNSQLRAIAPYLMARSVKVGVILRDPRAIVESVALAYKQGLGWAIGYVQKGFYEVAYLMSLGVPYWFCPDPEKPEGTLADESEWDRLCQWAMATDLGQPDYSKEDPAAGVRDFHRAHDFFFEERLGWYERKIHSWRENLIQQKNSVPGEPSDAR